MKRQDFSSIFLHVNEICSSLQLKTAGNIYLSWRDTLILAVLSIKLMATAAEGGEVSAEFFGMLDVLSGQPAFFFQMPDDGKIGRAHV